MVRTLLAVVAVAWVFAPSEVALFEQDSEVRVATIEPFCQRISKPSSTYGEFSEQYLSREKAKRYLEDDPGSKSGDRIEINLKACPQEGAVLVTLE
jgi:hypothetical protein